MPLIGKQWTHTVTIPTFLWTQGNNILCMRYAVDDNYLDIIQY